RARAGGGGAGAAGARPSGGRRRERRRGRRRGAAHALDLPCPMASSRSMRPLALVLLLTGCSPAALPEEAHHPARPDAPAGPPIQPTALSSTPLADDPDPIPESSGPHSGHDLGHDAPPAGQDRKSTR